MNNNIEREIFDIYVEDIIPNRFQPRLNFDERSLSELSESIKQHGIIQPLVVRKVGDKYEIIAGERRYKAAQLAGFQKVPAVIMNMDDRESAEVAVVENIQRRDLSALEEAESYKKLLDKGYLTQEQLATRMGKAQATISNKLRLLSLDKEVKDALLNDKISERHARSLLSLKDPQEQKNILNKILDNKLTVRQTDDLIKSMISPEVNVVSKENTEISQTENVNNNEYETLDILTPNSIIPEEKNETAITNGLPSFGSAEPFSFLDIPEVAILEPATSVTESVSNPEAQIIPREEVSVPNIDIDQIKAQSEDINIEKPLADVSSLLGGPISEKVESNEVLSSTPEEPRFRFISTAFDEEETEQPKAEESKKETMGLDAFMRPIEIKEEPKTYTDSLVQEYRQANGFNTETREIISGNLQSAISAITDLTKALEKHDFKVNIEEFDFEHLYQIIIKIEK